MRRIALLALLMLCAGVAHAQQRTDITMRVDGVDRFFIVVRPSAPAPPEGYPLVFMFHGSSGDGERFYNISGWKEVGEAEGFVTVFPSSLEYCIDEDGDRKRTTKWNNGDLQMLLCPGQDVKDDVAFVRAMIDSVASRLPIDRSRLYASGFSNGGVFTSKLAVEMSDVFAAGSAAAGFLFALDSGSAVRNMPFIYSLGDHDDRYLTAAGIPVIPFNDSALGVVQSYLRRHLAVLGLTEEYTVNQAGLLLAFSFTTPESGEPPAELRYILFKDLDHVYPNGDNHPLSAAALTWAFYEERRLSGVTVDPAEEHPDVVVVPNPATTHLRIDGVEPSGVILRSLLGETIAEIAVGSDHRLILPDLPHGLYLMEIVTAKGRIVRRVIIGE